MVRTVSLVVVICVLLQISISKAWDSRLFPCVSGSFKTVSSSPCNGPFLISVKPYLMITPNVNNVPVPDNNGAAQTDINELIAKEIVEIQEEDKLEAEGREEESITTMETVTGENEIKIDDTLFDNDPVVSKENFEYTENIEKGENQEPSRDTLEKVD